MVWRRGLCQGLLVYRAHATCAAAPDQLGGVLDLVSARMWTRLFTCSTGYPLPAQRSWQTPASEVHGVNEALRITATAWTSSSAAGIAPLGSAQAAPGPSVEAVEDAERATGGLWDMRCTLAARQALTTMRGNASHPLRDTVLHQLDGKLLAQLKECQPSGPALCAVLRALRGGSVLPDAAGMDALLEDKAVAWLRSSPDAPHTILRSLALLLWDFSWRAASSHPPHQIFRDAGAWLAEVDWRALAAASVERELDGLVAQAIKALHGCGDGGSNVDSVRAERLFRLACALVRFSYCPSDALAAALAARVPPLAPHLSDKGCAQDFATDIVGLLRILS
ncbi:hypothetical protein WJX81_003875 [Elliptochloris bilobata]|uniref:PUL domain-containing protein n=1 Tax=Elliptochloris bilobata TaxID=381761 RepID=A0AAW1RET4_9CHLO